MKQITAKKLEKQLTAFIGEYVNVLLDGSAHDDDDDDDDCIRTLPISPPFVDTHVGVDDDAVDEDADETG